MEISLEGLKNLVSSQNKDLNLGLGHDSVPKGSRTLVGLPRISAKTKKIKIRFPPHTPRSLIPLCLNLPSVTFHSAGPWMTTSLGWPSFWKCALFNLPLCH